MDRDQPRWTVGLGEIISVHAEEQVLTNGKLDWIKLRPLIFTFPDGNYWQLGDHVAKAWEIGKRYQGELNVTPLPGAHS